MGERKSQSRGDHTRARLLQATRVVLVDGGAAAFSMRAVAAVAGVGLSNLQFHYANQQALLAAILDDELRVGEQLVAEAIARDDARSPLERALEALLQQHKDVDTMKVYLALWSFAAHDEVLRTALSSFYARYVEHVVDACAVFSDQPRSTLQQRARVAVSLLEGASLFRSGVAGGLGADDDALLVRTLLGLLTAPAPDSAGFSAGSETST
jgi:AcrR family transcriptional regulator